MTDKPTTVHSLERTSPKGSQFIGRCVLCGKRGLTFVDIDEHCENPIAATQDEALLQALEPDND